MQVLLLTRYTVPNELIGDTKVLRVQVNDKVSYSITKRTYTDEGFLSVPGRVARTGIQQYLASELGLTDRAPNQIVNVYRPPEEVFNPDSLASYDTRDVTLEHPNEMVNADNYNSTTVGLVHGAAYQDGDFVTANIIVKSKEAIKAVESGKVQLSAGYTAIYSEEKGVTDDGQNYDFVQRDIKINHVAICDRARAGAQARLFDNHGVKTMNKVTLDAGRSIEIEDAAVAALVTDSIARLEKQVTDAQAATDAASAERDTIAEKLKAAELATSDEAITKRVADVASVQAQARKVAGDKFTCGSVDTLTIQREALTMVRDSIDWSEKAEAYVQAAFDMAVVDAEATPVHKPEDQHAKLALDAANAQKPAEVKVSAYDAHRAKLQNAWKGE